MNENRNLDIDKLCGKRFAEVKPYISVDLIKLPAAFYRQQVH